MTVIVAKASFFCNDIWCCSRYIIAKTTYVTHISSYLLQLQKLLQKNKRKKTFLQQLKSLQKGLFLSQQLKMYWAISTTTYSCNIVIYWAFANYNSCKSTHFFLQQFFPFKISFFCNRYHSTLNYIFISKYILLNIYRHYVHKKLMVNQIYSKLLEEKLSHLIKITKIMHVISLQNYISWYIQLLNLGILSFIEIIFRTHIFY